MEKNLIVVNAFGASTCNYKTWGSTVQPNQEAHIPISWVASIDINRLAVIAHGVLDLARGSSSWTSGAGISLA